MDLTWTPEERAFREEVRTFVKEKLPIIVPNIIKFEKLNIKKEWDAHNSDTYDAIVCSLFG